MKRGFGAMVEAKDILSKRRGIWRSKPILRRLYHQWYRLIVDALRPGKTVELGGGSGNLKEFLPGAITSDIVFCQWLDAVLDAHALPFKDESLDNIVLFDVLHHLARPALFFSEAQRALKPSGRIVMMEPYVSWVSFLVYRFLHQEGMHWHVDPFGKERSMKGRDPFLGNQAVPTLLFERHRECFKERYPGLRIVREERTDLFVYPLSGGFHHQNRCPTRWLGFLQNLERVFLPLAEFLAFRLFLVLEKTESPSQA